MSKTYPVLKRREVLDILKALGFEEVCCEGSHCKYQAMIGGIKRSVTVDRAINDFDDFLLRSMVRQAGVSRQEFYGATKATKLKI
jgi:predicted RNA binding protein YcfA (HicA-like mRNA interferase family)